MRSEKEKMVAGEMYDARDPRLVAERRRARDLLHAYNHSLEGEQELRARVLADPMGSAGGGLWIEPPFHCDYGSNITLGENVFFNFDCVVLDVAPVRIGSRVMFGPGAHVYTATHPLSAAERRKGLESGIAVEIGDDAWIGGGAIICPGVRIGERAVIAAGSVVTRDVPAGLLAAGNPCRVVREIEE